MPTPFPPNRLEPAPLTSGKHKPLGIDINTSLLQEREK
jgi:hypothetical protein